ncbi:MAG: helix-turn-helix transcriptional regulator [Bacteroidetes bacterium]|nr:helix-turn-helix transcriptional regulator [Bacteroidota bacterium]
MEFVFLPEGFFPFLKIPVSEFKNQMLGAGEVGFNPAKLMNEQLMEATGIEMRLSILEKELLSILDEDNNTPESFRKLFNTLKQSCNTMNIKEFCQQNTVSMRSLERMYNKYVGVSANTYNALNRFHNSLNQLLYNDYSKLSDIAYGNDYFDQMHFIRDFKRFAGNTPKNFVHRNNSILQIGKFS